MIIRYNTPNRILKGYYILTSAFRNPCKEAAYYNAIYRLVIILL